MSWFQRLFGRRQKPKQQPQGQQGAPAQPDQPSACRQDFLALFEGDDTFITRPVMCGDVECCIAFFDGMVNNQLINRNIVVPLVESHPERGTDIKEWIEKHSVNINEMKHVTEINDMLSGVLSGDTVLFAQGMEGAFVLNTKGFTSRAIEEPELEKVTRGSHDGFTEPIMVNLSLIRRRLQTPDLKMKMHKIGTRSNTKVCVVYLDSLVNNAVLDELNRRLNKVNIDGILASNYIEELINDNKYSIFRTIGFTERPDTICSRLLEGRVAIVVDNTPAVMTVPHLFIEYFQTAQDYFEHFYTGTLGRLMRIAGFLLTIIIPGFYVALVTQHQEMIPSGLLLAINAARQQVPLPTIFETIVLLFAFDLLRESGTRLPSYLGQSLSIVGGLVIGQAAVQARLISAPVVIVVAFTGITSLIVPKLNTPAMALRIIMILLANFYGLFGVAFGVIGLLLHLLSMQSFGVPYLQGVMPLNLQDAKDIAVRAPWWQMKLRPRKISTKDNVRLGDDDA